MVSQIENMAAFWLFAIEQLAGPQNGSMVVPRRIQIRKLGTEKGSEIKTVLV